ncbi:MAG: FAD-binding oxidoreductase [Boseongicola sp.]
MTSRDTRSNVPSMLKPFDDTLAEALQRRLPDLSLRPAEQRYLEEPRGKFSAEPTFVAAPLATEMVAEVVRFAGSVPIGIQPYGGGTGLVGGQVTPNGPAPIILSLEKLNTIRAVYPSERAIVAEAGVTISEIQAAAEDAGLLFPLSYGSQQSAQIGAGLSVNSGGLNVLRYGMARDLCLGIEAVLPDGSVHHGLKRLRKDNTGYDLRNLLIGAEGTLGIITAASLNLVARPANTATAFLAVSSPAAALEILQRLFDQAGEVVSAFELLSGTGLRFLNETQPETRQPFASPPDWSVLVEIGTAASTEPDKVLEKLFETAINENLVYDGLIAQNGQQRDELWAVREMIPVANRAVQPVASHDISLPLSIIPEFIETAGAAIKAIGAFQINPFGHLGDGNLHYNVFPPAGRKASGFADVAPEITRLVHDMTIENGGSFSAEHGIGRMKVEELGRYGDSAKLVVMRKIKAALDPLGIMNPGAVLPCTEDQ